MKKLFFPLILSALMFGCYPDNRNKDRSPDAQMDKDTVVHPNAQRDSAAITNPQMEKSQLDSPMSKNMR